MNRREFLVSIAGTLLAPRLLAQEPRVLRVGHTLKDDSAVRGAQLGAEEAGRTAELLGARLELVNGKDGVLAVVGDLDGESAIPFLNIRSTEERVPMRPNVFHVASSMAERREALERWQGPKSEGVRVVDWHPSLTKFGAEQLNQRFETRFGSPMDERAWAAWLAVMAAAEAALRNTTLERLRFDGHKGARLSFRSEDHTLRQPLYVVAGDKVLGEVGVEEE
ncbi:MAG TPA: hypothetical protein VH394_26785 [Thermoanaerobaculia bacterium]|jgi:hypothetical protein|nr:hypothetical protein [Thermoanaerobaculia bacterium]